MIGGRIILIQHTPFYKEYECIILDEYKDTRPNWWAYNTDIGRIYSLGDEPQVGFIIDNSILRTHGYELSREVIENFTQGERTDLDIYGFGDPL